MVSSGGLTGRLSRLEAKGLVKREAAPEDGRSLLVVLTAKGRALAEKAMRADVAVEAEILSGLASDEQCQLAELLSKLLQSVEED